MQLTVEESSQMVLNRAKESLVQKGVDPDLLKESEMLKELIPFSEVRMADKGKLFYLQVANLELVHDALIYGQPMMSPYNLRHLKPPIRNHKFYYYPFQIFATPPIIDISRVSNLIVGMQNVGEIRFMAPVDLQGVNFKE